MNKKRKQEKYEIIEVTEIIDKAAAGQKLTPEEQKIYDDIDFPSIVLSTEKGITWKGKVPKGE